MPEQVHRDLMRFYRALAPPERAPFLNLLTSRLGIQEAEITRAAAAWTQLMAGERGGSPAGSPVVAPGSPAPSPGPGPSGEALFRAAERLRLAALPLYTQLFAPISREADGIPFLVELRAHVRQALTDKPSLGPALRALDTHLKQALSGWFTPGLLECTRLEWATASGQLLQKVMRYEAVHAISSWEDMQARLGPDRRVHAYFHPCLPGEPLVILHAALTSVVPSSMRQVLAVAPADDPNGWHPTQGNGQPRTAPPSQASGTGPAAPSVAVFYSISSTQTGLAGVDLGHFLISDVARKIKAELPSISCLVTLSPLPGFKPWLQTKLAALALEQQEQCKQAGGTGASSNSVSPTAGSAPRASPGPLDEDLPTLAAGGGVRFRGLRPAMLPPPPLIAPAETAALLAAAPRLLGPDEHAKLVAAGGSPAACLALVLESGAWVHDMQGGLDALLQGLLVRAAARYLVLERRRNLALDPVAHFHLRNGARLLRINPRCDMSEAGLARSYGIMVNYSYDLDEAQTNNQRYLVDHEIRASHLVTNLLSV